MPIAVSLMLAALIVLAAQPNRPASGRNAAELTEPFAGSTVMQETAREIPRKPRNAVVSWSLPAPRILVKKAERKLFLYSGGSLVRVYRVGLGLSPIGDKIRQGDRRTPEGEFYIFTKNDKSAFYLSLGLSYPNVPHADRGLSAGLITKAQHAAIVAAIKARKTPPQNTRLGGDIYIHGRGASSDWTWGCVALEDMDMRALFDAVAIGTPVTIEP